MTEPLENRVEALQHIVVFLFKNLKETMATVETLRAMLEQRDGAYSHEAIEPLRKEALGQFDAHLNDVLKKGLDAYETKLLEQFQGTGKPN
jgi:hypothetical protein